MSDSSVSFTSSLRTLKVSPGLGNYAQTVRADNTPVIHNVNFDYAGRPTSQFAGAPIANTSIGVYGLWYSPELRIVNENLVTRANYSAYLNVPQGVIDGGEQPRYIGTTNDLMGVNRGYSFGLNGTYSLPPYPANATNPNSAEDYAKQQQYYTAHTNRKFENRHIIE